jgi:hypothetical protein
MKIIITPSKDLENSQVSHCAVENRKRVIRVHMSSDVLDIEIATDDQWIEGQIGYDEHIEKVATTLFTSWTIDGVFKSLSES